MPCNQNCNQGRDCQCGRDRSVDRATTVIAVLLILCLFSIGLGLYKLYHGNKGSECAVEVQFSGSKATYIGTSI